MAGLNKIYYDLLIIWKWLTIFGPPCRARWSHHRCTEKWYM